MISLAFVQKLKKVCGIRNLSRSSKEFKVCVYVDGRNRIFTYHQISACNNIVGDSIYRITDMSIRVETFESEIGEVHDAMKLLTGMLNDVQRNLKVFSSHHDNNNVGQEGFRDLEGRMEKLERFCDSSGS